MAARHGMESDEEANFEANPPQVSTALFGPMTALGHANFKANPHQVSTALFGLTAVFGSTTGGKTQGKMGQGVSAAYFFLATTAGGNFQGKTGQGVSAAEFFPQGHQYEKEAEAHGVSTRGRQIDKEAGARDVHGSCAGAATNRSSDEDSYNMADFSFGYVVDTNLKAMRDLADNRFIHGTSASRMAAARGPQQPPTGGPAWAQTTRPGCGTFRKTPSPTEPRNGCTWWS
jgi:hypothetical protein